MAVEFIKFKNKVTGEIFLAPSGRYGNFVNAIKKVVKYVRYNIPSYYVAHLTLTVAENISEVDFKHLHRVLQFIDKRLKRAGSDFKYVAVKEIQERGAVHYHILCIYSKRYMFPSAQEIAKSWKLGFVKITAPKIRMRLGKIVNYIGKYIGKGYEYEALNFRKSFTASQIKQIYKLSTKRLAEVIAEFGKEMAEGFKCTYRKVYKYTYAKKLVYTIKDSFLEVIEKTECVKKELIKEFPSEWAYEGVCQEAF